MKALSTLYKCGGGFFIPMITATEAIKRARIYVGGTSADDEEMLIHLNRAAEEITTRSRALTASLRFSIIDNQYQYGLPDHALDMWEVRYRRSGDRWPPLRRTRLGKALNYSIGYGKNYLSYPNCYDIWGRAYIEKIINLPIASTTEDPDNPDLETSEYIFTIEGIFYDIKPADIVINLTDLNAESEVLSSSVENGITTLMITPFRGGERIYPVVDNNVRIISPHRYNKILIVAPAPNKTDDVGIESLAIFLSLRHRIVTQENIDDENDVMEIDVDLEEAFHYLFQHFIEVGVSGETSEAALLLYSKYNAKYSESMPRVRRQIREAMNLWEDDLKYGLHSNHYDTSTSKTDFVSAYAQVRS